MFRIFFSYTCKQFQSGPHHGPDGFFAVWGPLLCPNFYYAFIHFNFSFLLMLMISERNLYGNPQAMMICAATLVTKV